MLKPFFLLFTFLFFTRPIPAQDRQLEKKADNLLTKYFKTAEPGCAVLISRQGKTIYKKAFGSADLQLNVPLSQDMVFNIASITKQFTAVAILQLAEQGKISLQDSLQKFIPDFPSKGYPITIEHLLTHSSGIRDYMQISYAGVNMERWDFTPKQLIDSFKNHALEFEPGTRFSYSNSGYYLLGYIIEKVSGKRYQGYIQDNLLLPLGLTHTYFDSAGIIIPNRVNGYVKDGAGYKNEEYWSPTLEYAAGGLISNADDLLAWHRGLYSYRILKKENLQKAFTPYRLKNGTATGYGYGWYLKTSNNISSIEHQGGLPGFQSNEIYYPAEDIFIGILCNCGAAPIDELSVNISNIVLGKELQTDIKIGLEKLEKYIGVYKLTIDPKRTITILKHNDQLVAKVSDTEMIPLLFGSETKFQFKNLLNADCEFITAGDKVTKFTVNQNGYFEWIKIE